MKFCADLGPHAVLKQILQSVVYFGSDVCLDGRNYFVHVSVDM